MEIKCQGLKCKLEQKPLAYFIYTEHSDPVKYSPRNVNTRNLFLLFCFSFPIIYRHFHSLSLY